MKAPEEVRLPGSEETARRARNVILAAGCMAIACGLFAAGLWPFDFFPANQARWLPQGNGLGFDRPGIVVSSGAFEPQMAEGHAYCAVEIWLQPRDAYLYQSATVLEFQDPSNIEGFRLQQYRDDMFVRRGFKNQQGRVQQAEIDIQHLFGNQPQSLVTLTSDPGATSFYVNGRFVDLSRHFGMSCRDFSGWLVLGNSSVAYNSWAGKILGLAFYGHPLSADQVLRHYHDWMDGSSPHSIEVDHPMAAYVFSEQSGRIVHNRVGPGPDLFIPKTFSIPRKRMLKPAWEEFSLTREYAEDVIINVIGFVPFGLFCCAYLSRKLQWKRAVGLAALFGGLISLTIEVLQRFVPSRSSGMTDIVTNTLGTAIGAAIWMCLPIREQVRKRLLLGEGKGTSGAR